MNNIKIPSLSKIVLLLTVIMFASCNFEHEVAGTGSIEDLTPPSAAFTATQSAGAGVDDWQMYSFGNASSSATSYVWDFGNGDTSTDFEPSTIYTAEGDYIVTLTAQDDLGVTSTSTQTITVSKPLIPIIADPVLINTEFDKQAKSSGSDCACSGWINKSIGSQGESTSGNGSDVIKFDNDEPDAAYQEFEVTPNADYTVKVIVGFDASAGGTLPSTLELRILSGAGYVSGYSPTYYTAAADFPQDNFGYTTINQVEATANNLVVKTIAHPNNSSYTSYEFTFNAGNNTSVALYMRGIGGDDTSNDSKQQQFNGIFNNGDEEIQVDSVTITAN
ncbi:PKD domain-containing protein [Polaribacter pectinis]|uniref:PKD domain-containing protein n=1 Tax=Polaribacter pectinis TaxID=2738844 RepID=A0A7G9L9L2_9FLAO|nr:PKD domain-containing protein [Polaribacter pectinis]QNM85311.1 PKD domain-containing protein [Polaribacter pectinis]